MGMWLIIFLIAFIVVILCAVYLISRIRKASFIRRASKGKKAAAWGISALIVIASGALIVLTLNMTNAFVCFLYLVSIWIICDLAGFILKKIFKRETPYNTGAVAVCLTVIVLMLGWYFAHHVSATRYVINTDKSSSNLRILQFADSHVGTTFDAAKFSEHVDKMQQEDPDVVLITGDFVDDDTSREEMLESCKALSKLHPKYGVFFSYGNHDRGYMNAGKRGWTADELADALAENGVIILEDEPYFINDDYCIIGRRDISSGSRLSMEQLSENIDSRIFTIILDHQPGDYEAQERSGVDLVLSGHTHGGQLIPITYVGEWIGANDRTYGYERRGNTNFIVTSGISDWAIKFKTGCKSEYVVIDVEGNSNG